MNLWNVIRETAQANTATQAENKAFAQKHHALQEQLQHEQERYTKLQAYTEHLQEELKLSQHELEALREQHTNAVEISLQHDETIRELRGLHLDQEEVLMRKNEENSLLREQLEHLQTEQAAEKTHFHTSLEALKQDLSFSRQQALNVASEVDEAKRELEDVRSERNAFFEENEQLRWRLEALEQQIEEDRLAMERKVEEARLHSGEMTVQFEEAKRLASESKERIQALTEERNSLKNSLEKSEQEAQTWQQIAEEQTVRITELQNIEQEITEKLTKELTQKFEQQLEYVRQESASTLSAELTSIKNRYELALETLKTQLQEARLQHQQTLQSYTDDHEQTVTTLEEEISALKHQADEQTRTLLEEQERVRKLQTLADQSIRLSDTERLTLASAVKDLLERVETHLVAFDAQP